MGTSPHFLNQNSFNLIVYNTQMKRTPAQQKADKKYDSKRKREQLNIKLSSDEKLVLDKLFSELKGSKKEVLIRALKLLKKNEFDITG